MYGYSRKDALGRISSRLLRTRYPDGHNVAYDGVTRTGLWTGRLVQTRKDGTDVHVDARWVLDPPSNVILEVNREVTEEVAMAERFQLLVESVKDYAIFLLDAEGRVSSWNEGARRIKGYAAAEIVGRHFSVFYPAEDIASGKPAWELQTAAAEGRLEDEGWRVRQDGTQFWAVVVITALRDSGGRLTGFAKVTRDFTDKQLEKQRLLDLERTKSSFLNLVAHELRSPLTVLRGYLSLMRDLDEGGRRTLEARSLPALEAKTIEMTRLVDQMVEVARLEEGNLHMRADRVDLVPLVEEAVEHASVLAEPANQVRSESLPEELNVVGDPDRIRIILGNLLSNALKYSPGGGEVTVRLAREAEVGRIVVVDEGIGVPLEDQIKLFNRFMRMDRPEVSHVPGTGMGLYLSRELARRQGGDLVLMWSSPNGSAFGLHLPLAK